jgi:MFS family permease
MVHRESNWIGVAFGLVLAAYAAFQQFKLPPALPLMLESYGYDRTLAGGFMSAYAVAGLALSFAMGRLIERRGAAIPIGAGLCLMTAGLVLTLAMPEAGTLVLASRTLEGIAFAVFAIAGPVLANANASARHLPVVIALTAAWIPIGQLLAVALAEPSFILAGWSGLWWIGLAMSAAMMLWLLGLRLSGRVDMGPRNHKSAATAANRSTVSKAERISLIVTAAVFMVWSAQYFAFMTWLPQYLVEALGLSVSGAVAGYALPVAILLISIMATGQILRRGVPVGPLMVAGLALQVASWVLLPIAGGGLGGALALVLYGTAAGIVPTCLFAMPSAIVGHGQAAATAFGIIMTGRNAGVFAGPIALAQLFALTGGWTWAAPMLGIVTGIALALGVWLATRLSGVAYGTSR